MDTILAPALSANVSSVLWYPFFLRSASQEQAAPLLPTSWKSLYHRFPATLGLQWIAYPLAFNESHYLRHHVSPLSSEMIAGATLSPFASLWKTSVLSDKSMMNLLQDSFQGKCNPIRAQGWWIARSSIVCPSVLSGKKWTIQGLDQFGIEDQTCRMVAPMIIPGILATLISHPADLITGMLCGDPYRVKWKSGYSAIRGIVSLRGYRGLLIASPMRCIAFTIECNLFPYLMKQWPWFQ
jgi:hypothetical protein